MGMMIGVAGTGRMGAAIVRRLLVLGHEVRVWNRTAANAQAALDAGAIWCPTPGALVADSQVVISFLLDNAAVEQSYLGPGGLLAGSVEGRLFIDMSTVSPGIHSRVAAAVKARNAGFIECPVSGSVAAAHSGTLVGFAGGEPADFARAQPLLNMLCRRVELVGALGAGTRMKLAANLLLTVFWQALGEALLLADPAPADAALAIELLADSNIGAAILRTRATQIVAAMYGDMPRAAAFDIDTMVKDLRYMAEEAGARGSAVPLASRTLECFDHASREGGGGVDAVAYPAYWIARQRAAPGAIPHSAPALAVSLEP
jgi:3-hydroxyisobutyrate dehydrogenase